MSDELKDFRYYADKAESMLTDAADLDRSLTETQWRTNIAAVYAELAKTATKVDHSQLTRCSEWLSQGNRNLPDGFRDYQCVLFAGHGTEHEVQ